MCDLCSENLIYENIHSHSHYSNVQTIDSIITKEDIAIRAKALGHKTLSLVEHGYFANIFETYDVAQKYDLNLIFGAEFYFVKDRFEKDNTNAHLLIMAKNETGRKEITKMVSESNRTGYYYKPRIDEELLFNLTPENVLVTSACIASPIRKYGEEYAHYFIKKAKKYFGDNFYLEVQPHKHSLQVSWNAKLIEYREKHNVPFILGIDSHYIEIKDGAKRDLFLKGKGINYPEEEGFILDYPTVEEILERFKEQGVLSNKMIKEAFDSTLVARDFEPVTLNDDIKMPTIYPDLTHEEKSVKLKEIINEEWKKDRRHINKEKWPEYLDAIKQETSVIVDTDTEDYFLLNYEIIKKATEEYGGVLTRTGRGSAPSMYVNKLLGFTEIDRLEAPIQLYSSRFMSKSRILETRSLPDVDMNTSDPQPFIQASKDLLGDDGCHWMVAYGTMKESSSFRNLCRAKRLNPSDYNEVAKHLDDYQNHSYWGPLIEESKMFVGVIDSVSPHPCANILLSNPVSEELGTIKVGNLQVALIDSGSSDKYKYLKNDYLTVTVWKIIADTYEKIGQPIDDVRSLIYKTDGNEKVWNLYSSGIVATLNQAGTPSGKPQIMQYKPKNIRELSGWVAAIRPAFSSMKHYFLNRKDFSYGIPEFDELLKPSDNFVLYQESIMATLQYAGFSEDSTYGLLKAIAKKKEGIIEPIHDQFIDGFVKKTGSEENALKVWKIIEDAVGYSFNSSHSYSVGLDSLYGAYLKATYPLQYYSVILNIYNGNKAKQGEIVKELDYFNISLNPIKFGKSRALYELDEENNAIYKGLSSIANLNEKVAEELFELAKQHNYERFSDVILAIILNTSANATQLKNLILLDYFSDFGEKEVLLKLYEFVGGFFNKNLSEKTKEKRIKWIKVVERKMFAMPFKKQTIQEALEFEQDKLGYIMKTFPTVPESLYYVTEINKQYTPKISLYRLQDGEETLMKMKKGDFYVRKTANSLYEDTSAVFVGDVIQVIRTEQDWGKKLVDGKWTNTENIDIFIKQVKVIRPSNKRKLVNIIE